MVSISITIIVFFSYYVFVNSYTVFLLSLICRSFAKKNPKSCIRNVVILKRIKLSF